MSPQQRSLFSKGRTRSGGGSWTEEQKAPEAFGPPGYHTMLIPGRGGVKRNFFLSWLVQGRKLPPQPFVTFSPFLNMVKASPMRLGRKEKEECLLPDLIEEFHAFASRGYHEAVQHYVCINPCNYQLISTFAYFCLSALFCSLQVPERMQWEFQFQGSVKLGNGPGYKWT